MSCIGRARQYFRAIRVEIFGLDKAAITYAAANLSSAELAVWNEQAAADRDHSYRVALTAGRSMAEMMARENNQAGFIAAPNGTWSACTARQTIIRAALLHDCGRGRFGTSFFKAIAVLLNAVCPQKSRRLAENAARQRHNGQTEGDINSFADLMFHYYYHAAVGAARLQKIYAVASTDPAECAAQERIMYLVRHHHGGAAEDADLKILIAADRAN